MGLNRIHEGALDLVEYEKAGNEDQKGRCDADGGGVKRYGAGAGKHPAGALHHERHGVAPQQHPPLRGNDERCRVDDWGAVHPDLGEKRQCKTQIPVLGGKGRYPHPHTQPDEGALEYQKREKNDAGGGAHGWSSEKEPGVEAEKHDQIQEKMCKVRKKCGKRNDQSRKIDL